MRVAPITVLRNVAALVILITIAAFARGGPKLKCVVVVPKEYRKKPFNPPPNGEPEPVRYTKAYEAFWWNCVAVRAIDLEGRCPFMASGTEAAAAGASDGALKADEQICKLLKKYAPQVVKEYLQSIAGQPEAHEKMRGYFEKPTPEQQ